MSDLVSKAPIISHVNDGEKTTADIAQKLNYDH
jgi:hypothetical protein